MCQPVYSAGARRARPLQLPPLPRFRSGYTERSHRESVDRSTRSKRAKSSHRKRGSGTDRGIEDTAKLTHTCRMGYQYVATYMHMPTVVFGIPDHT